MVGWQPGTSAAFAVPGLPENSRELNYLVTAVICSELTDRLVGKNFAHRKREETAPF
jgi:hypothetical protein